MTAATCKRLGCKNPPRPAKDPTRRKPGYCSDACRQAAWRERQLPDVRPLGEVTGSPQALDEDLPSVGYPNIPKRLLPAGRRPSS